jgi:peptide/nickel transport system substrate-binding protein
MKRLALLSGIAIATAGLLAALAPAAEAQTPRRGGVVRMTAPYASSFGNLDPHRSGRSQDGQVHMTIHRTLYIWDSAKGAPALELATAATASAGGTVWTFKLRDDAFFHNGRKMNADDVVWSFTRLMSAGEGFVGARWIRLVQGAVAVERGEAKEISGIKKLGEHEVEITFTQKVEPGFLFYNMTTSILPREEVEKPSWATAPVGLGPFKFKEHIPGSRLVAERFDRFYKPGLPYLDRVEFPIMAEASARDIAFRNKEVDTSILGPVQYVAYGRDPVLSKNILEVAEVFTRSMVMNHEVKPFDDKRVRQAINHAINTQIIVERLARNKAYRATSWLPITVPGYDNDMKPYEFNPAKARALLAEAGLPNGFEFEWTTSQNESWGLPIVEAVIPMLAQVGIRVKTKVVEVAVLTDIALKGEFQAYIGSSQTGPDPLQTLRCYHSSTPRTSCNVTQYKNTDYDKMLDEAGTTDDPARKLELLKRANAHLFDAAPVWFFNYNKATLAFQPWVHGLQANPTELVHQYPEFIWVDASSPAK